MIDESKEIIERLKKCIDKSGLTYLELEKKTGIAKSSLQRYANGVTKKIPVDSIQTIAKAIGVAPEYILGWELNISSKQNQILLTPHEENVICAYRSKPEMQPAVDRLLGVEN